VRIYYSSKFAKEYKRLPKNIKLLAEKKELIFRANQYESQLKTHKLQGRLKSFWAFSINREYRIIFEFKDNNTVWFHSIGTHAIYD
jgi:addiction module RelE/StbE family toxin